MKQVNKFNGRTDFDEQVIISFNSDEEYRMPNEEAMRIANSLIELATPDNYGPPFSILNQVIYPIIAVGLVGAVLYGAFLS